MVKFQRTNKIIDQALVTQLSCNFFELLCEFRWCFGASLQIDKIKNKKMRIVEKTDKIGVKLPVPCNIVGDNRSPGMIILIDVKL